MNRVFNSLTVRTIDEDQRVIEGWATTGRTDRVGDIVEPAGAEFDLPIPFLLDHDHSSAVGEVELAEVTSKGIRFVARIKKIPEAGQAKDLVDRAWHLLKYGLRKTVSIGFQPLEWTPLPEGGMRFTKWSWYELSAVSVPANQDAVIESVKRAPASRNAIAASKAPDVRLTKRDILLGKAMVESRRRAEARKRLGIPEAPVKLSAADLVEGHLATVRENLRAERRAKLAGKVSILP